MAEQSNLKRIFQLSEDQQVDQVLPFYCIGLPGLTPLGVKRLNFHVVLSKLGSNKK